MSSAHLPGPHGFIIATKLSLFLLLFCCVAPFFSTLERNQSISIESPVQLLNNSFPFFNNLLVNETNSFPPEPNSLQGKPNSYPVVLYWEPNSYPVVLYREPNSLQGKPNSYPVIAYLEPNSYPIVAYWEPNSYPVVLYREPNSHPVVLYRKPNSYPIVAYLEPNSLQNNSIPSRSETLVNNTSEQTILYLLLHLQNTYVDSENTTIENQTIQYDIERNIILNQINSFFIFSI